MPLLITITKKNISKHFFSPHLHTFTRTQYSLPLRQNNSRVRVEIIPRKNVPLLSLFLSACALTFSFISSKSSFSLLLDIILYTYIAQQVQSQQHQIAAAAATVRFSHHHHHRRTATFSYISYISLPLPLISLYAYTLAAAVHVQRVVYFVQRGAATAVPCDTSRFRTTA